MIKNNHMHIFAALGVLVVLIGLLNIYQLFSAATTADQKIAEYQEASRPADLEITILTPVACTGCTDAASEVEAVKSANTNVTSEKNLKADSPEAKQLISKYSIARLPSIIVTGEIGKVSLQGFTKKDDALVFEPAIPPFVDTATGLTKGLVDAIIIKDSSCASCLDMKSGLAQISGSGIYINSQEELERTDSKPQGLIKKYNIAKLPALLLSPGIGDYGQQIKDSLAQVATQAPDGVYVIQNPAAPYVEAATGEIKGLVTMTVLSDASCKECYDSAAFNTPILAKFGLVPVSTVKVDVASAEGKAIIAKYNITVVPLFILSSEAREYSSLVSVWPDVGTIEGDGSFVFRKAELAGQPYKILATGAVVNPGQGQ